MKTSLRHIIFEFTLTIDSNEKIFLGFLKKSKEVKISKDVSALGFLVGDSKEFITNQVIFYN
jgi:hypothetical protein